MINRLKQVFLVDSYRATLFHASTYVSDKNDTDTSMFCLVGNKNKKFSVCYQKQSEKKQTTQKEHQN